MLVVPRRRTATWTSISARKSTKARAAMRLSPEKLDEADRDTAAESPRRLRLLDGGAYTEGVQAERQRGCEGQEGQPLDNAEPKRPTEATRLRVEHSAQNRFAKVR